jgi:hypothetical protein
MEGASLGMQAGVQGRSPRWGSGEGAKLLNVDFFSKIRLFWSDFHVQFFSHRGEQGFFKDFLELHRPQGISKKECNFIKK